MPPVVATSRPQKAKPRASKGEARLKMTVSASRLGVAEPRPKPLKLAVVNRVVKPAATIGDDASVIAYNDAHGVKHFITRIARATPMQLVETERHGVQGVFLKDFSKHIGVPAVRVYEMLGVPKATAEKRSAEGTDVTGAGGQAALAMAKLLAKAQALVDNSTSPQAKQFDAGKWLGQWIEQPQPALGGRKPADLIATPTGVEMVSRLLGAVESGSYQ